MTLSDIQNQLVLFFFENDIFNVDSDYTKLNLSEYAADKNVDLSNDELKETIGIALKNLSDSGIVSGINKNKWILNRSFESNVQNVEVSPETAILLAGFVNGYSRASGIKDEEVQILNILDKDIQNACHIGQLLLNLLTNPDSKKEDESDED